jgi:hypothetical protein
MKLFTILKFKNKLNFKMKSSLTTKVDCCKQETINYFSDSFLMCCM